MESMDSLRLAVWTAEDGRCQVCHRPMDKRLARLRWYDPKGPKIAANAFLLCPLCLAHWASPLRGSKVRGDVAEALATALRMSRPEAAAWLRDALERYAVLVGRHKRSFDYWLPGVGNFRCRWRATKSPLITGHVQAEPDLVVRHQSATRGLTAPTWPTDREWTPMVSPIDVANPDQSHAG